MIGQLRDIDRKAIIAATSHSTIGIDFILSDDEYAVAMKIFNDLDRVQNGKIPEGYAVAIPESHHRAIWAATCALVNDIHTPLDNLIGEQWDQLEAVHKFINFWDCEPHETVKSTVMR